MPPRKRFSAFEDYSTQGVETPAGQTNEKGLIKTNLTATPRMERIEHLKPSQMMPDRFQPRRLLPTGIRASFYSKRINCYQAAAEWLALAKTDGGIQAEVEKLLAMGSTFSEHGQIKAITGSWRSEPDGTYIFQIETGERRFWAACLQYIHQGSSEEPELRVEAVDHPTRQRQVLENRHSETPTAVEQACEVSSLILAELETFPDPSIKDDYEYFRQARERRMPAGLWDKITPIMQLTRPRMVQLLNILQFSSEQLDLADHYQLPERVLREILAFPKTQWDRLIKASIQQQLTSDDLTAMEPLSQPDTGQSKGKSPSAPAYVPNTNKNVLKSIRKFLSSYSKVSTESKTQLLDDLADTIITSGNSTIFMEWLKEITRLLENRIKRQN